MTQHAVALVDDDADFRAATAQTLALAGFSVTTYGDAQAFLDQLGADFAGVVVSDIRMPRMSGLDLFAMLHQFDRDLPAVLVTGHGDVDMAVKGGPGGCL